MKIQRFTKFKAQNEDTILDECGYPEASLIVDVLPFFKADEKLVFLFLDEDDFQWILSPDAFKMHLYDSYNTKSYIVDETYRKSFVVFIKDYNDYIFYGIYKMADPYVHSGALSGATDVYAPLEFSLEQSEYAY